MSHETLITLLITSIASVIAKEIISWLILLVKNNFSYETFWRDLKTVFRKSNRQIFYEVLTIAMYLGVFFLLFCTGRQITGLTVLVGIGLAIACISIAVSLVRKACMLFDHGDL